MAEASRDQNRVTTLLGTSNADGITPVTVYADPTTHRLLVDLPTGGGSVTSVSVVTANGFAGTVATATTTPAITIQTTLGSGSIPVSNGTGFQAASLTGTGNIVLATSPTLITPNLGTPSTLVGTNITGTAAGLTAGTASAVAVGGITGLGTGVATALAVNVGSAGAFVTFNGALGTPSSGVATNLTGTAAGLTAGTASAVAVGGITGLGTGVATWLATPSSSNLAAAVTGETGSGALVFGTSPDFTTAITLGGVAVPTISSTNTLTNKRVTRRTATTNAPGATPTTNSDNVDYQVFTGLATAITSMTTNLSGTPAAGDFLEFWLTDNGTARAITWGASFASTTITLPTTTVISTKLRVLFEWGGSTWDCVATA